MMSLNQTLDIVRHSDVGQKRDHNEDAVASDASIGLLILADGMGGYKAGEVASEMAVLTIAAELKETLKNQADIFNQAAYIFDTDSAVKAMSDAVKKANEVIYQVSIDQPQCAGMGTTLVACLFTDNQVVVGHIGDSRLYLLRSGTIKQITEDHSLLQEQLKLGLITPEQAKYSNNKNLVTRALGVEAEVELELHQYSVLPNDIYILCSDGLSDLVDEDDIAYIANTLDRDLQGMAEKLIKVANENGGKDNISVVIAKVLKPFPLKTSKIQRFLSWLK